MGLGDLKEVKPCKGCGAGWDPYDSPECHPLCDAEDDTHCYASEDYDIGYGFGLQDGSRSGYTLGFQQGMVAGAAIIAWAEAIRVWPRPMHCMACKAEIQRDKPMCHCWPDGWPSGPER